MTDIQAAVGLVQLDRLGEMVALRRHLAARYQKLLQDVSGVVSTVQDPPYGRANFQSFWVLLDSAGPSGRRDRALADLAAAGVSARRGIMAAHLEPAYAGHPSAPLPATERLTRDSLILPLHHLLTEADQDRVVEALANSLANQDAGNQEQ
jgi:perosamine synthetase